VGAPEGLGKASVGKVVPRPSQMQDWVEMVAVEDLAIRRTAPQGRWGAVDHLPTARQVPLAQREVFVQEDNSHGERAPDGTHSNP